MKTMTHESDINVLEQRTDTPRSLDRSKDAGTPFDERGHTIAWVIRDIYRLYTAVGQKAVAPWNITMAHWYYLRVLEAGPLNQLELSKRVGMASTTAVPALDFLENQGLVARTRDPNDRRKYNVSLTPQGRQLIPEVMRAFEPVFEDSLKAIPSGDLKTTWRTLLLIESNLMAATGGAVPSQVL